MYQNLVINPEVVTYYDGLKENQTLLTGHDYGQGTTRTSQVSELSKKSASKHFESLLLAKLCRFHKVGRVLELGSNLGKATAYMSSACPEAIIDSVDGNKALIDFAQLGFNKLQLPNAKPQQNSFESFFETNKERYDLIFIDGDHHYKPTIENYQESKRILKGDGPIVLHDLYWSQGMTDAWEWIKQDVEATVTIDLFFFGLVYFRPAQEKQHFRIRYPSRLSELFFIAFLLFLQHSI
ncbi:MAG: class I SAM-dependent methyltransferase [Salibacteraceae bacterium]